jgi:hypothetical protein
MICKLLSSGNHARPLPAFPHISELIGGRLPIGVVNMGEPLRMAVQVVELVG